MVGIWVTLDMYLIHRIANQRHISCCMYRNGWGLGQLALAAWLAEAWSLLPVVRVRCRERRTVVEWLQECGVGKQRCTVVWRLVDCNDGISDVVTTALRRYLRQIPEYYRICSGFVQISVSHIRNTWRGKIVNLAILFALKMARFHFLVALASDGTLVARLKAGLEMTKNVNDFSQHEQGPGIGSLAVCCKYPGCQSEIHGHWFPSTQASVDVSP